MLAPIVLALAMVPADPPVHPGLPADWHGRWTGTLKITSATGEGKETPMEMVIEQAFQLQSVHVAELKRAKAN